MHSLFSDMDDNEYIEFKQVKKHFFGAPAELLNREYFKTHKHLNCFVVIKCISIKGEISYLILDYVLGETLAPGRERMLDEKEYERLVEKKGVPIVLTSYNKQFFIKD